MSHNISLPRHFYCLVRAEYLHNLESHEGDLIKGVVHGVSSTPGRALGFHVVLQDGARFSDLPVSALCTDAGAPAWPLQTVELWDCFGYDVHAVEYTYLREMEVLWNLPGPGPWVPGTYVCSFDWTGNGFSDEPSQHKEVHLVLLDNGCFILQPNNRLKFIDRSFVTIKHETPTYKLNHQVWWAEHSFVIPDGEEAFYDVRKP